MSEISLAAYLALLQNLSRTLAELTETAYQKTAAVRRDDLAELDGCIKKEQALSMSLRGYEQKRESMLRPLGLEGTNLRALAGRCPAELQSQARQIVEELLRQYQLYASAAEVARNTLECNLHQIELFLATSEQELGAGYEAQAPEPQPPSAMRADFRA